MSKLLLSLTTAALVVGFASAALPPGSYNALRAEAGEVVIVEVTKAVTTAVNGPNTVTLTAKVLHVDKSSSKVKVGDTITIQYVTPKEGLQIAGPKPQPMLTKGDVRVGYLNWDAATKSYAIAAHGWSFDGQIENLAK